jgi:hypothetical protein
MRSFMTCLPPFRFCLPVLVFVGAFVMGSAFSGWAADEPAAPPAPSTAVEAPTPPGVPADKPGTKQRRHKKAKAFRQACGEDVKKFCANVKQGDGRIKQCLDEHAQEVSSPCKSMLQKHASKTP